MRPLCVQTPNGQRLPSTDYRDGQFRLRLPNPVQGGSYSCLVPAVAANVSCNHGPDNATVTVDAVEARLALLEAHVTGLEHDKQQLQLNNSRLQLQVSGLEADRKQLQGQVTGLASSNANLEAKVSALQADKNTLQAQVDGLEKKNADLVAVDTEMKQHIMAVSGKENQTAQAVSVMQANLSSLAAHDNTTALALTSLQTQQAALQHHLSSLAAHDLETSLALKNLTASFQGAYTLFNSVQELEATL